MRKLAKAMAFVAIVAVGVAWTSDARAADATDIYIVQLRDNPVVAYGGELGFAATKPVRGQKIDPNAPAVKDYVHHLTTTHDNIVAAIGGAKVHSYKYTFNGFAARMTAQQAAALQQMGDVVQVWPDELMQPQTDSTPQFLGLSGWRGVWSRDRLLGEDVVVGVIDTGIWPEHPSFAATDCGDGSSGHWWQRWRCRPYRYNPWIKGRWLDWEQARAARYGAPPEGFTSSGCDFGNAAINPLDAPFECNNKLVAARYFAGAFSTPGTTNPADGSGGDGDGLIPSEYLSARDNDGHGSHTGSTAAGNLHVPASIDGESLGRVSGMAPRARIAAYKVCWNGTFPPDGFQNGCASSDSMAAIDQAVADGVDVINFSIGGSSTTFGGPDDVAFLFAADAGVFVATSNGNTGPGPETTGTPAGVPWITAVGATVDNKARFPGLEADAPDSVAGVYEAREGSGPIFLEDTGAISAPLVPAIPEVGCSALTNGAAIDGNIALVKRGECAFSDKYNSAAAAGAVAIVVYNDGTAPDRFGPVGMSTPGTTIPGLGIGFLDGELLAGTAGVSVTMDPEVQLAKKNTIADFSSRGPNGGAPDIIKPDVAAPGVQILAAQTPTPNDEQTPGQLFQIISGTSMASPHVAGVGALLKQQHPDWSPAMIRSALMTTARTNIKKSFSDDPADAFDIGAGQIRPQKALSPGIVYDAGLFEYAAFTCGAEGQPPIFTPGTCAFLESVGFSLESSELNLPSIGVAALLGETTVTRTVTSVAKGRTTWRVKVQAPPGIDVSVNPSALTLEEGQVATYQVTFTNEAAPYNEWAFGSLTWVGTSGRHRHGGHCWDGDHKMRARSPIAIQPIPLSAPAEVSQTEAGESGSLEYDIEIGFEGDLSLVPEGLVAAEVQPDSVASGGNTLHFVFVPPGTRYARFALFDSEVGDGSGSDDLDLQVQGPDTAGFPFLDFSGSASSNEEINLIDPEPGLYAVFVIHYQTAQDPTPYNLYFWPFGPDAGNMTIDGPASASFGESTITVDWNGLAPATRYRGGVVYGDGVGEIGRTVIGIDTN